MDLNTITVADFKALFFRDFPYLPVWSASTTYNIGDVAYYTNNLFYKSLINTNTSLPTDTDDWVLYPTTIYNYVLDADITKAFSEAKLEFNQGLFSSDADIKLGYLYLAAFFLVNDLQTAKAGVSAVGTGLVKTRSVGSVNESYDTPDWILDNPLYAIYWANRYGQKYLSFIIPLLVGNVGVVEGTTLP